MTFGLFSPLGLAAIGLYVYVGVAVGKAEISQGGSIGSAALRAALWPASIWAIIKAKYKV